jgi:4-carboxymuconolactone decarboxylase
MARLAIPSDTPEFDEETRVAVRHIQQTRKSMPPPSSYLTYAGKAGALLSDLVEHLRYHTSLTDAETELAICTAVRAANADYIWNAHVRLGLQAGTREEAIHAIDTYGPLDTLAADEALIIRFGRELLDVRQVSDETFSAVEARYGKKGLLELTALMGVYTMNATILRAMDHRAPASARHLTPR